MTEPLRLETLTLTVITSKEHARLQHQWYKEVDECLWHDPVQIVTPIRTETYEELLAAFIASPRAYSVAYYDLIMRHWTKYPARKLFPESIEALAHMLDRNTHPASHLELGFSPKEGFPEEDYKRRIRMDFTRRELGVVSYQVIAPVWTKHLFTWAEPRPLLEMARFNATYDYDLARDTAEEEGIRPS